jgi:hypothetical protein
MYSAKPWPEDIHWTASSSVNGSSNKKAFSEIQN